MIAYKLVRQGTDEKIYPLFINKKEPFIFNQWLDAECYPTKGFAVRKGWHCCFEMNAPNLKKELANGQKRVWIKCDVEDFTTYNRPESQGGKWILANRMKVLKIIG